MIDSNKNAVPGADQAGIFYLPDVSAQKIAPPIPAATLSNPSFLALHPNGRVLYSVIEAGRFQDEDGGGVAALERDPASGALKLKNSQAVGAGGPCDVEVDATGRWLATANYGGGSVSLFPLEADGSVAARSDLAQHSGSGAHPNRQKRPHAHGVTFSPDSQFLLVPDLGTDRIWVYRLDEEGKKLIPHPPGHTAAPGAGPRQFSFSPDGTHGYLVNELDNTVTTFSWDAEKGELTAIQTLPTLPEGFVGTNTAASIAVHPGGRFVYSSNRGDDSLALFLRDPADGKLSVAGHFPCGGKTPRNIAISPCGAWLFVANQGSDQVVRFRIDMETGKIVPDGEPIPAFKPAFVLPVAGTGDMSP